jgi:UDP-glucose 4-epimerase
MRVTVTGGAGFIGSNLVDRLLEAGHDVVALDDLSTGHRRFLKEASNHTAFRFEEVDLLDPTTDLRELVRGSDAIVHLAANADVRFGWDDPERDLQQNVVVTHRMLEAARVEGVGHFVFSSTGSVYGEAPVIPTPEDCPFPVQTSLYAASKLAAEGFIQAYAEGAGLRTTIFRFVSVLGARYTHGHVIDFVRALQANPRELRILGDGTQRKSYMEVRDCVGAILLALADERCRGVFNLGVDGSCVVTESARWICERLGVDPEFRFTGGDRGWVGDNPYIHLDPSRMQALGWQPAFPIRAAVEGTVDWLLSEPWVLDLPDARVPSPSGDPRP